MGKFRIRQLKAQLSGRFRDIQTVIETGTFRGESTQVMADHFKNVITIELDDQLHRETSKRLKGQGYKNIRFIHGDSGEAIVKLTKEVKEPAIFFLDAHWSGDTSVDWNSSSWQGYGVNTAHLGDSDKPSGEEQVPLDREMTAIAENFEKEAIIYIDDLKNFDFWGKGLKNRAFDGEDYSHIDLRDFRKILGNRIRDWINTDEQLIIKIDKQARNKEEAAEQRRYFHTTFRIKLMFRTILRLIKRILIVPFQKAYWSVAGLFQKTI